MELILTKTPSQMIQNHVLPMLASALSSTSIQIQELCMSIIPNFADRLDIQIMKTSILPKIKYIAVEGSTIAVSIVFLYSVALLFILLSRESDQCAVMSLLRNFPPPVYLTKMDESR